MSGIFSNVAVYDFDVVKAFIRFASTLKVRDAFVLPSDQETNLYPAEGVAFIVYEVPNLYVPAPLTVPPPFEFTLTTQDGSV